MGNEESPPKDIDMNHLVEKSEDSRANTPKNMKLIQIGQKSSAIQNAASTTTSKLNITLNNKK